MTLLQFATDKKTGKLKRGALSRIAEQQSVCITTVKHWLTGALKPNEDHAQAIKEMIRSGFVICAKKPGPKQRTVKHTENGVSQASIRKQFHDSRL